MHIFQNINDMDDYIQLHYKSLERKIYVKSLLTRVFFHNGHIVS